MIHDSPVPSRGDLVIVFLAVTSSLTYPPFNLRPFVFALQPFKYVRLIDVWDGLWSGWALVSGPRVCFETPHWPGLTTLAADQNQRACYRQLVLNVIVARRINL